MKILYVSTMSGTMGFFTKHINMLLDQGHTVDMACNVIKPINSQLVNRGCKVYDVSFSRTPFKFDNYRAFKKIKKIILEGEYDIVHTHTPIASMLSRIACINLNKPKVVYTVHGFHFYSGAPIKNWLIYYPIEKILANKTDFLITMNQQDFAAALKLKKGQEDSVLFINGVGVSLDRFGKPTTTHKKKLREHYEIPDKQFVLFYAAELNENKNQVLLIKTIEKLKEKIPNVLLLLAGSSECKEKYNNLIRELKITKYVRLLGHRKDIDNLLRIADVAVASSKREGLPVNIMEAMATGLPIVATKSRGHVDLIKDGTNGYLVDADNPRKFADAINYLYRSEEQRKLIGDYNAICIKKYSDREVLKKLKCIYQKIFEELH